MSNSMRITIIGAGIGGLSAAVALRDIGADVTVIERTPEFRVVGAGICMWPNGARALHALGIAEKLEATSPVLRQICYRDQNGRILRELSVDDLTKRVGQRPFPLARSDLHAALLSRLEPNTVRLGRICVDVQQDDSSVRVTLDDGNTIESDVLVGADGIRSVVRQYVTGGSPRMPYHFTSWVGLVQSELNTTPNDTFTIHVQDSKRVGLLPVGDGRTYFFCDAVSDSEDIGESPLAELQRHFVGWPVVRILAGAIDDNSIRKLAVHDLDTLGSFVRNRIVLLGDAAHATTPTLGQGGALAMEDSLVLARCLAECPDQDLALARYDAERLSRTRNVVLASRARTAATLGLDGSSAQAWQERLVTNNNQDFLDQLVEIHQTGPLALA